MQRWKVVAVASIIALTSLKAFAQSHGPFIPVDNGWTISERSRVGAISRIRALDQNPYPFCFSYAATSLFDQHRCMASGRDCSKQLRSSSLAAVSEGQQLPPNEIDITKGGVGSRSLRQLTEKGFVSDSVCNYNISDPTNPEYQNNLSQQLHASTSLISFREGWLKYQAYTPYLERFYRTHFTTFARKISPSITDEDVLKILKMQQSDTQLLGTLLLTPACFENIKIEENYNIKTLIIESEAQSKQAFETINKLLSKNIPVFSGVCVGNVSNGKCSTTLHAIVIIARSHAYSKLTGDKRTVYWIVNSWGESWQEKNFDGWVFGETLVERLIGEILWLEK
jgi:hypothetical protein